MVLHMLFVFLLSFSVIVSLSLRFLANKSSHLARLFIRAAEALTFLTH